MNPVVTGGEIEAQLACFLLGPETYAFDIMKIKEIIPFQKIRPVPRAPRFVRGVINLRGAVIPVVDLRERFGLSVDAEMDRTARIIVTSLAGKIMGLVVDAVTEILKVGAGGIVRVPSLLSRRETSYVQGIALSEAVLVLILNLDRLLSTEEVVDMESLRKAALDATGVRPPGERKEMTPQEAAGQLGGALLRAGGVPEGPPPAEPPAPAPEPAPGAKPKRKAKKGKP